VDIEVRLKYPLRIAPGVNVDPSRLADGTVWQAHPEASESTAVIEPLCATKAKRKRQKTGIHSSAIVEHSNARPFLRIALEVSCADMDALRARLECVVHQFGDC